MGEGEGEFKLSMENNGQMVPRNRKAFAYDALGC